MFWFLKRSESGGASMGCGVWLREESPRLEYGFTIYSKYSYLFLCTHECQPRSSMMWVATDSVINKGSLLFYKLGFE